MTPDIVTILLFISVDWKKNKHIDFCFTIMQEKSRFWILLSNFEFNGGKACDTTENKLISNSFCQSISMCSKIMFDLLISNRSAINF